MALNRLQLLQRAILNFAVFLDPPLHCNKFAVKAVGWFKSKRMVMYTFKVFE